jgi:hypothetical protein
MGSTSHLNTIILHVTRALASTINLYINTCCFCKNFKIFAMLLIGHDLHHICGLHVIGVFNLFEHCISLEIPVFNSCV